MPETRPILEQETARVRAVQDKRVSSRVADPPTLYVLTASHPCIAAELMLRRKGIAYRRVELPVLLSRGILRALRFPRKTVPALRLANARVQGSRRISRALDELRPEPPLFPTESLARIRVEQAERFGEELQDAARRIELWGLGRDRSGIEVQLRASTLPIPPRVGGRLAGPALRRYRTINGASTDAVHRDLMALPAMLDRIDGWIEAGVIGGEEPNAGDLQIAPSVRLLMTMEDLRPTIEPRPAGRLAKRLVPGYPSHLRAGVLPMADDEVTRAVGA
jgi:glutathione S-transferase